MFFSFDHITVAYGKNTILRDVSLSLSRGEIVTLVGPNGCGKSTLLGTVFGGIRPKSGQVMFDGKPLSVYPQKELAARIAYLAQTQSAPSDISVRTLVSYGRYPYLKFGHGMTQEDREAVDRALRMTGLTHLADRPLAGLSGGERQRAWIAMTAAKEPELLILDEPTTYLDVGAQLEVLSLIRHLRDTTGAAVLMVLHDLNLAARVSDRLYAMGDGGIIASGTPNELMTPEFLAHVFGIGGRIIRDDMHGCPYVIPQMMEKEQSK